MGRAMVTRVPLLTARGTTRARGVPRTPVKKDVRDCRAVAMMYDAQAAFARCGPCALAFRSFPSEIVASNA
jgi:hypothetical protein